MKNGFTAKKTVFNDRDGFMVTQWIDGENMIEQFVRDDEYDEFCEFIGTIPEMEDIEC